MILQPGADDFLAVVEVFRPDKADHAIDQERIEGTRNRVGAGLAGLLIDAMVGARGKGGALSGLEIHHVLADAAPPQRLSRLMGLPQQRQVHAKAAVGGLRSRNRLKYQIDWRALPDQGERRRHMGENAALSRNLQAGNDLVEQPQQAADHSRVVTCRVYAYVYIARSHQ